MNDIKMDPIFIDECLNALQALCHRGFRFEHNKKLQDALDGLVPMNDQIKRTLAMRYLEFKRRLPARIKRNVFECKNINVPSSYLQGYEALLNELRSGADLLPRMSRKIWDLDFIDGAFLDWGIHHFHIGNAPVQDGHDMVEGTALIAYVFMPERDAYVITVDEHGRWTDKRLISTLIQNYPDALRKWETCFSDLSYEPDDIGRTMNRKRNLNMMVKIGDKVYANPVSRTIDGFSGYILN